MFSTDYSSAFFEVVLFMTIESNSAAGLYDTQVKKSTKTVYRKGKNGGFSLDLIIRRINIVNLG